MVKQTSKSNLHDISFVVVFACENKRTRSEANINNNKVRWSVSFLASSHLCASARFQCPYPFEKVL